MDSNKKKSYSTPKLTVHGTVDEITNVNVNCTTKHLGSTDGLVVAGLGPITCAS